jgi:hypothetical protein
VSRDGASTWRYPTADFSVSLDRLQDAVQGACARQGRWEEKVAAGIHAALGFAAAEPAAAHALTLYAPGHPSERGKRQDEMLAHFAGLLGQVAPSDSRYSISTDAAIVESIATLVRGHLLAGNAADLPSFAPDLAYLALMPYAGPAGARRWAETSARFSVKGMG